MPDFEPAGDAATGASLGRAAEPVAGEGRAHSDEHSCLNCGCELGGEYCHCCGQRAHVHRTLGAFWHDLLHSVLHFEGKIWRTLPMLALHPGELTRRYIGGERAKFVSPLALFLFTVFMMFAIFSAIGGPFTETSSRQREEAVAEMQREAAQLRTRIADLERRRDALATYRQPTGDLDAQLVDLRNELRALDGAQTFVLLPSSSPEASSKVDLRNFKTGWAPLDGAVEKARENPSLLIYKLQTNAYKFSWALIPISLPFVWLLFLHRRHYRRQYGAYDHLIFVTCSIAFMSLGAILLALLQPLGLGKTAVGWAVTLIPPIHIYRQLRGAYRLTVFSALWRTFVLLFSAGFALTLFLMLLLLLGLLG